MAGMLDLLSQLHVQQAPDPRTQNWGMESFSNALGGLAQQMEADKERKRLAAEREQKQARDRFELLQKLSSQAQGAGDKQRAGELYQQSVDYGNKLGLSMKPLVGGRRMLSGADVLNMDMTQNPNVGLNDAGQAYAQDFTNDQSQSRISGWNGYKPAKPEELDPYKTYLDPVTRKVLQTAQARPVTPMYSMVPGTDYAVNMRNPSQGVHTGVMPQMTPDQAADNTRQDRALAFRQQVQQQRDSIMNAAAKAKDGRAQNTLRLRIKQLARQQVKDPFTGAIDEEAAKLAEQELLQEFDLRVETAKDKATLASAGDTTKNQQANDKAKKALTSIYGGGSNYLDFSMAFPENHAEMLNYFVARAKGDKAAKMPLTGEQIRTMLEQVKGGTAPKPSAAPSPVGKLADQVLSGIKF